MRPLVAAVTCHFPRLEMCVNFGEVAILTFGVISILLQRGKMYRYISINSAHIHFYD